MTPFITESYLMGVLSALRGSSQNEESLFKNVTLLKSPRRKHWHNWLVIWHSIRYVGKKQRKVIDCHSKYTAAPCEEWEGANCSDDRVTDVGQVMACLYMCACDTKRQTALHKGAVMHNMHVSLFHWIFSLFIGGFFKWEQVLRKFTTSYCWWQIHSSPHWASRDTSYAVTPKFNNCANSTNTVWACFSMTSGLDSMECQST